MLTFLLFLISPLMSLPVCIYKICKQRYNYLYLLGAFFALWSMCIPPIADQSRYFIYIYNGDPLQVNSINDIVKLNIVHLACRICLLYKINLELLRAVIVFTSWSVIVGVIIDILRKNKNIRPDSLFCGCLILIGAYPYMQIAYGFRWGAACCLTAAALYWIFCRQKYFLGGFFIFMSCFTHIAIIGYLALGYMFFLVNIKSRLSFIILSIFLIFIGQAMILSLTYDLFPDFILFRAYLAPDAYWNTGYVEIRSFNAKILAFLRPIPCYFYLLFIIRQWDRDLLFKRVSIVLFLVWFTVLPQTNLYGRFQHIIFLLCAFDLFYHLTCNPTKTCSCLRFGAILFLGLFLLNQAAMRKFRDFQMEVNFIFYTSIQMLSHSYSDDYFFKKITDDGNYFYDKQ